MKCSFSRISFGISVCLLCKRHFVCFVTVHHLPFVLFSALFFVICVANSTHWHCAIFGMGITQNTRCKHTKITNSFSQIAPVILAAVVVDIFLDLQHSIASREFNTGFNGLQHTNKMHKHTLTLSKVSKACSKYQRIIQAVRFFFGHCCP